jgi:hypothetical protein
LCGSTKFQPLDDPSALHLIEYLPKHVKDKMYTSFAKGWAQCFEAIHYNLERKEVPSVAAIQAELHSGYLYEYASIFLIEVY